MRFGEALDACMKGARISRTGWNGRNMFVYYTPGKEFDTEDWYGPVPLTPEENSRGFVRTVGHFDMYSAQGDRVIGWLASQTDMQADDWFTVVE